MDLVNLKDEIEKINKETLPELERILKNLADQITATIERLDGLTVTIKLKEKVNEVSNNTINSTPSIHF